MDSLKKILSLYGLVSPGVVKSIERMLLIAIKFHQPDKSEQEIKNYFQNEDLILVLNNLILYSQQFFFARQDERWELFIPAWIVDNKSEILKLCLQTHLCNPVLPEAKEYDAVAIFGANKSEIFRRYRFLHHLIKSKKIKIKNCVYLLTGHRKLTPRIDGSEAYLIYLHQKFGSDLIETHVMVDLYDKFNFAKELGSLVGVKVIDTPEVNNRRPNTYDTLIELRKQLMPADKKILFISRSPAFLEQKAAVDRAFTGSEVIYEVAGGGCGLFEVKDEARASYHILMSIAGALYENYLVVGQQLIDEQKIYDISQLESFKKQLGFRNNPVKEVIFSNQRLTAH